MGERGEWLIYGIGTSTFFCNVFRNLIIIVFVEIMELNVCSAHDLYGFNFSTD